MLRLDCEHHREGHFLFFLHPCPTYVLSRKHTTDLDGKPQTRQTEIKADSMYMHEVKR